METVYSLDFRSLVVRHRQRVVDDDPLDYEHAVAVVDLAAGLHLVTVPLHFDLTRLQRAGKGAGQSAAGGGHHVVERGGVRRVVLGAHAVVLGHLGVDAERHRVVLGRQVGEPLRATEALGEALGEALTGEGIELHLGQLASAARRHGDGYALDLADGSELRGDKLLVATGRIPNTADIGLETVGIEPDKKGVQVDERMSAGDGLWAIGDCTGIWPFTHIGKYQGRVAAANILGKRARASYDAVPRVVFTDPQVASVGEGEGEHTVTAELAEVARTSTYTRAYAEKPGFLTLVSDGERLTGAHAIGPEAGEWLQQATLAIRARVPLETLVDTIQPFPTFSEAYLNALSELVSKLPAKAKAAV